MPGLQGILRQDWTEVNSKIPKWLWAWSFQGPVPHLHAFISPPSTFPFQIPAQVVSSMTPWSSHFSFHESLLCGVPVSACYIYWYTSTSYNHEAGVIVIVMDRGQSQAVLQLGHQQFDRLGIWKWLLVQNTQNGSAWEFKKKKKA